MRQAPARATILVVEDEPELRDELVELLTPARILLDAIFRNVEAEHERSTAEARLRAIIDTAVDAIVTIAEDGVVIAVNPAFTSILGYAKFGVCRKSADEAAAIASARRIRKSRTGLACCRVSFHASFRQRENASAASVALGSPTSRPGRPAGKAR